MAIKTCVEMQKSFSAWLKWKSRRIDKSKMQQNETLKWINDVIHESCDLNVSQASTEETKTSDLLEFYFYFLFYSENSVKINARFGWKPAWYHDVFIKLRFITNAVILNIQFYLHIKWF